MGEDQMAITHTNPPYKGRGRQITEIRQEIGASTVLHGNPEVSDVGDLLLSPIDESAGYARRGKRFTRCNFATRRSYRADRPSRGIRRVRSEQGFLKGPSSSCRVQ